ncbi:MAG: hypothetical protein N4A35_17805 [Flavobacteriales bacterium]|jgi:DNA-binding transcriptional regulator GbsR (MarR family)|nr:hypothetical protein [Flavobacteriales bacterium]
MTEKDQYIEQVGLFYEKYGLPKMAGRILGYLIASSTENNSFDDLMNALQASKGSISGNLKLLTNQKMIEKHMVTGIRQSYYRIATNSLNNMIASKVASIGLFKDIIAKGIALNDNDESWVKNELKSIHSYYEFLENEIPKLRLKWEQLNANNK